MLFRYIPHNGCGAQLDHRLSRITCEAASHGRSMALHRAPMPTLIDISF